MWGWGSHWGTHISHYLINSSCSRVAFLWAVNRILIQLLTSNEPYLTFPIGHRYLGAHKKLIKIHSYTRSFLTLFVFLFLFLNFVSQVLTWEHKTHSLECLRAQGVLDVGELGVSVSWWGGGVWKGCILVQVTLNKGVSLSQGCHSLIKG
jgi:hypothetical protein